MPQITISPLAHATIARSATSRFKSAPQNSDGTYTIELEVDTLERLDLIKARSETYSDLILRLFAGRPH